MMAASHDDEHETPLRTQRKGSGLWRMMLWGVAFVALIFFGMIIISHFTIGQLNSVRESLHELNNTVLQWLRLVFIVVTTVYWVPINTWVAKRNEWSAAKLQQILASRLLVCGVLIFIELFFVRRVHEYIPRLFT
jgi:magnesium-transporting ATPase (P-type)